MIEEVVNSILEAEDLAKKRLAEAERKAGEIVASAEAMKQADEQAAAQSNERLAELNSASDREIAAYSKNIDKAVQIIMEKSL